MMLKMFPSRYLQVFCQFRLCKANNSCLI
jgi:hypothetical protein